MLAIFSNRKWIQRCAFFYILLFICSCKQNPNRIDVSGVPVEIKAERLDQDLFSSPDKNISYLRSKYGSFFDLFCFKLTENGSPDTMLMKDKLNAFVIDADLKEINLVSEKIFHDFTPYDQQLTNAFKHYKYYFPGKPVPHVVTFISGFNYAVVAADSVLGVGLDMYLGSDSRYYPALQFPHYKIVRMRKEYLVNDCMRGWGQSEWEQDASQNDFISQAIYFGKIIYFLNAMMPDVADSIKTGYTSAQLKWCEINEKNIWSFFIDKKMLFSNDQNQILKYLNDGPTSSGFPKESPGAIGQWVGWRIIQSYMKNNSAVALEQLMNNNDYKKILHDSKYKPEK